MRGDGPRDVDADGGDFGRLVARICRASFDCTARADATHLGVTGPNAGKARDALCRDAKVSAATNQHLLQPPDVFNRPEGFAFALGRGESTQIEDRITDELTRAVESYVAAPVTVEDFDTSFSQQFR